VALGLVPSINRPAGNVTGVTFPGPQLGAKRVDLLHELAPKARVFAFLMDPNWPGRMARVSPRCSCPSKSVLCKRRLRRGLVVRLKRLFPGQDAIQRALRPEIGPHSGIM